MTSSQDNFRRINRRTLAGTALCLPFTWLGRFAAASSVDGRGVSNADVLSGFAALRRAPISFEDGRSFTLDEFRGRALLVNFWAHWCVNCIAEFKSMQQLQQVSGGEKRLAVVLVSQQQYWERDKAMAHQSQIPFPLAVLNEPATFAGNSMIASILLGSMVNQTARYGLPVCYMVGRSGDIVLAGAGGMDWMGQPAREKAAVALHT